MGRQSRWGFCWLFVFVMGFVGFHLLAVADEVDDDGNKADQAGEVDVALVDVAAVFKQYEAFKQQIEQIKVEVNAAEKRFAASRDEVQEMADKLKGLDKEGEEYLELAKDLLTRQTRLKAVAEKQKQQFMKREADAYAQSYEQIQHEVQQVAKARGIRLVLRYNSTPMDENNRDSVLSAVNKTVVFQDELDITKEVADRLNAEKVENKL